MECSLHSIGDCCLDGWIDVCIVKPSSNSYYCFYSFSPILTKLGTHDLRANARKTVKQIFEILISSWRILNLDLVCGTA